MLNTIWNESSSMIAALSTQRGFFVNPAILILFGIAMMVCLWHFWKFQIYPHFHPEIPRELPYWTPCMCPKRCIIWCLAKSVR